MSRSLLCTTALLLSQTACDLELPAESTTPTPTTIKVAQHIPTQADQNPTLPRSQFAQVHFAYAHDGCAYLYSPIDFCDTMHKEAYVNALADAPPNFATDLILLDIPIYPEYHQKSLVVIEPDTGIVWPFPFDVFAGPLDSSGNPVSDGVLNFSKNSSRVCIDGSLLVYRVIEEGRFCFTFDNGRFEGHPTQYAKDDPD